MSTRIDGQFPKKHPRPVLPNSLTTAPFRKRMGEGDSRVDTDNQRLGYTAASSSKEGKKRRGSAGLRGHEFQPGWEG